MLSFDTEEDRLRFIEELSDHLSISISGGTDYDCYSDREFVRISVSLSFDERVISICSDSF